MKSFLTWIISALFFAAVGGICAWAILSKPEHAEHEAETQPAHEGESHPQLTHDEAGNVVLTFHEETQKRVGLEITKLESAGRKPEMIAHGVLREDPSSAFTVRAPLPGTLRTAESTPWPKIGDMLAENATIGGLEPRLGPTERADLASRLNDALAQAEGARASLTALRAAYENKRQLNAQNKIVSDQDLQETEAKLKGEEARLQAALNTTHILESYLATTTQPAANIPLKATKSGQIVELAAQPGESIESGQFILRLARFDRFVARVSLPAGQVLNEPVGKCRVVIAGYDDSPLEAENASQAMETNTTTGGQTYLLTVAAGNLHLQPGMPVTAYLPISGEALQGVNVPRSAILRYLGKTWVYVQTAEDKFTRREVSLEMPTSQGWFTHDLKPGEPVVSSGAQSLLSQEVKLQTVSGEEEE